MQSVAEIIDVLKEKYFKQQPIPAEPEIPDFIILSDPLVVRKIRNGYSVEDLKTRQSFTVSRVNKIVFCSCELGKEIVHCEHKIAVWKEAKRLRKLKADECIKKQIAAGMSAYIFRLRQLVVAYERRGDTRNSSYLYYKGQLAGLRLTLRIVIEA